MTDRVTQFLVDMFDMAAHGVHAFLSELGYWLLGRVLNIPASGWN